MYETVALRSFKRPHHTWYEQQEAPRSDGMGATLLQSTLPRSSTRCCTPSSTRSSSRSSTLLSSIPPQLQSPRANRAILRSPTRSSTHSSTRSYRSRSSFHPPPPPQPPRPPSLPQPQYMTYRRRHEPKWKPYDVPTWTATSHRLHDNQHQYNVQQRYYNTAPKIVPRNKTPALQIEDPTRQIHYAKFQDSTAARDAYNVRDGLDISTHNIPTQRYPLNPFLSPLTTTSRETYQLFDRDTLKSRVLAIPAGRPNRHARSIWEWNQGYTKDEDRQLETMSSENHLFDWRARNKQSSSFYHTDRW